MLHTTIHCRRCLFSLQTTGVNRWQFHVLNTSLFRYQTQYGYRFTAFYYDVCLLLISIVMWAIISISNIYWMKIYTYWIVPKTDWNPKLIQISQIMSTRHNINIYLRRNKMQLHIFEIAQFIDSLRFYLQIRYGIWLTSNKVYIKLFMWKRKTEEVLFLVSEHFYGFRDKRYFKYHVIREKLLVLWISLWNQLTKGRITFINILDRLPVFDSNKEQLLHQVVYYEHQYNRAILLLQYYNRYLFSQSILYDRSERCFIWVL